MSVVIAGKWERGFIAPKNEADLWKYLLADFAVDEWAMTPVSGIDEANVQEFREIEDAINHFRNTHTVVFVDESADVELADFEHPEDAAYVFGRVAFDPITLKTEADLAVKISTPEAAGLLWPHQAAAIILYDRFRKWQ